MIVVLLLSLAAYRVTRLITVDEFPPVLMMRARVIDRWGIHSWQAYLIECLWCMGFWVSCATFAIAWGVGVSIPVPVASVLVSSAIIGILGNYWNE